MPDSDDQSVLTGKVGTTPRKSLVWLRRTNDFGDFIDLMSALLGLLQDSLQTGLSVDQPFPWLAVESTSLSSVVGAYDLSILAADDLIGIVNITEDIEESAQFLEEVSFDVTGSDASADFTALVAYQGAVQGSIAGSVQENNGRIQVRLGFGPERMTDNTAFVRRVLGHLEHEELLTLFYQSGHAVSRGSVFSNEIRAQAFESWYWANLSGHEVDREKPNVLGTQQIHDAIGREGDTSLFAWVVAEYGPEAWLLCDDGAGEAADFIRYDANEKLSLVHVKKSSGTNINRPVNATSYEQVLSQSTKNLLYLDPVRLLAKLTAPTNLRRASWIDGDRQNDCQEFLNELAGRPSRGRLEVVIVQPQMTLPTYNRVHALRTSSPEVMRLQLLETMLHSTRASAIGLGAELTVVGDGSL